MKIKTLLVAIAITAVHHASFAEAESDIIVLDLSKAETPLEFDTDNGAWTGTYDDDETEIESQVFSFVHNSMGDYDTWWGFTASNSANNKYQANTLKYQFSNMALGGIMLNEDGTVKLDDFGSPVTSAQMPYLVSYASSMMAKHPADMTFTTDENYEVIGAYFNLNSYAYYSIQNGDGVARAFNNGDSFNLLVHGVAPDETEKVVEVPLSSFANGDLTINHGWKYVDLSELGVVNQIWFSMTSTDVGAWGVNTPTYFCMDKLMVRPAKEGSIASAYRNSSIKYDRQTKIVTLADDESFAMVYDMLGNCVMSSSDHRQFSLEGLGAGIYIVKSGNDKIKIAR